MGQIYLIRHGETEWNAKGRIQGITPTSLNEVGRAQARALGEKFSEFPVKAIYTSPLPRARETAVLIALHHECEVIEEPFLHEGKFGKLEGITIEEFRNRYAEEIERRQALPREKRLHHRYDDGAESIHEIGMRVTPVIHKLITRHFGETILVVSHGFVMKSLLISMGLFDEHDFTITNAGFLHLTTEGAQLKLVRHEGVFFNNHWLK